MGPLPGAKKIELKIEARRARGSVAIPAAPGKDIELTYQFGVEDGRGTSPFHQAWPLSSWRYHRPPRRRDCGGDPPWGDVIDPDGDCKIKLENGGLSLEVPGHAPRPHDRDGQGQRPCVSSRKSTEISSPQVKVRGEFRPTAPRLGPEACPLTGRACCSGSTRTTSSASSAPPCGRTRRSEPSFLIEHHERGPAHGLGVRLNRGGEAST